MPISQYGPSDFEPFLSVYDTQNRARERAEQPQYAARLKQVFGSPATIGDYTYGRALGGQAEAIKTAALGRAASGTLRQAQTEFQKDADRRQWINNQALAAQRIENAKGNLARSLGSGAVQWFGKATAPIRPGGAAHGDFMDALESLGLRSLYP